MIDIKEEPYHFSKTSVHTVTRIGDRVIIEFKSKVIEMSLSEAMSLSSSLERNML